MWTVFSNGQRITQQHFFSQLQDADVILVGEFHNNAQGHQVEAEITREILSKTPSTAIAMEMFERQYQGLVDLFLQGHISANALEKATFASNWGGVDNTWQQWYQPIVNLVKDYYEQGARLIAANAARSYVKIASIEGYQPLQMLKEQGNTLFEIPDPAVDVTEYINNLNSFARPNVPAMAALARPGGFLDAQQLWDATMADSVAKAYQNHPKVMLFIGDFHVKRNGGTTQRVKHFLPDARVINVSILPVEQPEIWNDEHTNHAEFVIYTQAPDIAQS
ncbi:ChaN family lipoprotein [Endozoicomonas sp. SESOKO1]|uniref:ChaN family lipoprotein n=1 Tax=Endozoicomonas sp. SESOKO1 TaxID=2828742 RepID=UPI0021493D60|nr:ChaN family lipoprotein [Endozoicomonas sp. SESOKO1]